MLEQRIQTHFFESADLFYQVAETLSRPLATAAQMLVDGITAGGRVLCCGQGLAELDAQYMAALLIGRFEQDRPGLAACALDARTSLARQVQALGHPGDLLLLVDAHGSAGGGASWAPVLEAAHEQDMSIIALTGSQDEELRALLRDTDVQIRVPASRAARVAEAQRLLVHCLCDAVDMQLLGSGE